MKERMAVNDAHGHPLLGKTHMAACTGMLKVKGGAYSLSSAAVLVCAGPRLILVP